MNIADITNNLQYIKIGKKKSNKQLTNVEHTAETIMQSFQSVYDQNFKQVEKIYLNLYPELDECKLVDPKNISNVLKVDMLIRYSFSEHHLSPVCTIIKIVHDARDRTKDPPKCEDDFELNENTFIKKPQKKEYVIPIEYIVVNLYSKYIKLSPYTCFIFIALRKLGKKQNHIMNLAKTQLLKHDFKQTYNKRLTANDPIDEVLKIIESNR